MDDIINKLVKFSVINIVGVFRSDESETFFLISVKKNKTKLNIISEDLFSDFDILVNALDAKIPLILLVDGKGVLNKKIDLKNESDLEWINRLDYTSIHFSSFTNTSFQFFSFCRQNVVEDVMIRFQGKGYQVLDFYIGVNVSVLLNGTLKKTKVFANESVLNFQNDELVDLLKSAEVDKICQYEIGDKLISNYHLPLYGAAIQFFVQHKSIQKSLSKLINKEEILYKKAFDKLGISIIFGFFILLLGSYCSIQYFNSKNAELNLEALYSNQSFELIKKLEQQKLNKLKIVNETGIASSKYISFFNYELIASTPKEINLLDVDVFPLMKEVKSNEKISFKSKTINLKGLTQHESAFNLWLEVIRELNWVESLEIISIKKDKKNITFFELKIAIKNV